MTEFGRLDTRVGSPNAPVDHVPQPVSAVSPRENRATPCWHHVLMSITFTPTVPLVSSTSCGSVQRPSPTLVSLGVLPDPRVMPSEQLEAELVGHAEWEASGTARMLAVLAEFDRREVWASWECRSAQQWLSWKCGLGYTAATERLRVARVLPSLPAVAAGLAAGRLSWSKVREITRVATPADEQRWAVLAEAATASQIAVLVSAARRVTASDAEHQLDTRQFSWTSESDGSTTITIRLPAERARTIIDTVRAQTPVVKGQRWATNAADTLVDLVCGGGHTPAQVIAHVEADGSAHLEQGPGIAPEIAEAMACDGSVTTVLHYPTGPVEIDRRVSPSVGQRRWLALRHPTCQFPGCNHAGAFEAHHVIDRLKGGPTRLRNLTRLCGFHHRRVHLEHLVLMLHPDRTLTVTRADGTPVDRPVVRGAFTAPAATEPGNIGNWAGDPLHVDDCLLALGYGTFRPADHFSAERPDECCLS